VAFFPFYGKRISHRQLVITTDAKSFFFFIVSTSQKAVPLLLLLLLLWKMIIYSIPLVLSWAFLVIRNGRSNQICFSSPFVLLCQ
jgi:hypothetical protein